MTKLELIRKDRGLSRKALATAMCKNLGQNSTSGQISNYIDFIERAEKYKITIYPQYQKAISEILGCSFEDLEDENLENLTVEELIHKLKKFKQDTLISISFDTEKFGFMEVIETEDGATELILGRMIDEGSGDE